MAFSEFENNGSLVVILKMFYVTLENGEGSREIPLRATSLEDAHEKAEFYEQFGYQVTRVRPAVPQ